MISHRLHEAMVTDLFDILHEDENLLAINKSAGLVCHPTKGGEHSSLAGRLRLYLGAGPVHLINRLDRETSGIVLAAKTTDAARELRRQWETREVKKTYDAIVHGHVAENEGMIDAPLGKDEASEIAVKDCVRPDGHLSQTHYRVKNHFTRQNAQYTLLELSPRTGRKHQLRIHLAHLGHSIVGDKLYGGDEALYLKLVRGELTAADRRTLILENQALHATRLQFHWREADWQFEAPAPGVFDRFVNG